MWTTFAAVTGGAAGGLSSLIFLVVAFRFDTIAVSQEYRNRAAQSLTLFMTVTVVAVLLTVPQHTRALGGPLPGDQVTVPAQQRRRGDEEDRPPRPGQNPRQGGQDEPVAGGEPRSCRLTVQDRDLMTQDRDLDVLLIR